MNLCDDEHEEVCYEGPFCPVCNLLTEKENIIDSLKDKVTDLEEQVIDLQSQLDNLE